MTVGKIESGVMTLKKEEVSANDYVEECVAAFSAEAKSKGIKLQIIDVDDLVDADAGSASIGSAAVNNRNIISNNSKVSKFVFQTIFPGISVSLLKITDTDTVCMDRSKMDQVLRNLISKALTFSSEGTKEDR